MQAGCVRSGLSRTHSRSGLSRDHRSGLGPLQGLGSCISRLKIVDYSLGGEYEVGFCDMLEGVNLAFLYFETV